MMGGAAALASLQSGGKKKDGGSSNNSSARPSLIAETIKMWDDHLLYAPELKYILAQAKEG
jgi:hypothetical protein